MSNIAIKVDSHLYSQPELSAFDTRRPFGSHGSLSALLTLCYRFVPAIPSFALEMQLLAQHTLARLVLTAQNLASNP